MPPKASKAEPKVKKAPKKAKDGSKKAPSAYIIFSSEKRPEVKAANPDATFGEIGKILGKLWAELSDSEKESYKDKQKK